MGVSLSTTVVIPTYNRAQYIGRALLSVSQQTCPPHKVIVVDDGSTDNTGALIQKEFPWVDYIKQSNKGVSAARNVGINSAKTDLVAFLDSDDAWLPDKLQRQLQQLSEHPQTMLSHTEEIWMRNGVRVNQMDKHRKFGGNIYKKCLPLCVISPSSVIIRRELFDFVGMFDESMPACEDYDLWLRICSRFSVGYIAEPLIVKYGGHEDQLSKQYWGMDRFRIQALQKILDSGQLSPEDHTRTKDVLRKKCEVYIKGASKRGKNNEISEYSAIISRYGIATS